MESLWIGMGAGALYLAFRSFEPDYWQTVTVNIEGTTWLMRKLPVAARVAVLGFVGVLLLSLAAATLKRLKDGAPTLTMDMQGVEGYRSGTSGHTTRIGWDDVDQVKSIYGNLFIYAKKESLFSSRKRITVQLDSTGVSADDVMAGIQAFQTIHRMGLPLASAAPARQGETTPKPATAQTSNTAPDFGRRMTRI